MKYIVDVCMLSLAIGVLKKCLTAVTFSGLEGREHQLARKRQPTKGKRCLLYDFGQGTSCGPPRFVMYPTAAPLLYLLLHRSKDELSICGGPKALERALVK